MSGVWVPSCQWFCVPCGTYIGTGSFMCSVWERRFFQTAGLLLLHLLTVISGSSSRHGRCAVISLKQCIRRSGSFAWKVMPAGRSAGSRKCWPPPGQTQRLTWGREDAAPIATAALRSEAALQCLDSRFKRQPVVPATVRIVLIGL